MLCIEKEQLTWVPALNNLGSSNTPFAAIISFDCKEAVIWDLTKAESTEQKPYFFVCDTIKHSNIEIDYFVKPYEGRLELIDGPSFDWYETSIKKIKSAMYNGESWLLNLTASSEVLLEPDLPLRLLAKGLESNFIFWTALSSKEEIVSFSPEEFVSIQENVIRTKPMKGTIHLPPLATEAQIAEATKNLLSDQKELAEHITVVDLLRNDLGKISFPVEVKKFRYVERIETKASILLSTSSLIEGILDSTWKNKLGTIISELLPAGSISRAHPKKELVK